MLCPVRIKSVVMKTGMTYFSTEASLIFGNYSSFHFVSFPPKFSYGLGLWVPGGVSELEKFRLIFTFAQSDQNLAC